MTAIPCPCGSSSGFAACCGPILAGEPAPTAEALMRSRYTAFVRGDIGHIRATYAAEHRAKVGADLPAVEWIGLKIHGTSLGGAGDDTGTVDFTARFRENGLPGIHREISNFRREDGNWVYVDGDVRTQPGTQPGAAKPAKVGRNDPCPCGSGKKFKKCCGA